MFRNLQSTCFNYSKRLTHIFFMDSKLLSSVSSFCEVKWRPSDVVIVSSPLCYSKVICVQINLSSTTLKRKRRNSPLQDQPLVLQKPLALTPSALKLSFFSQCCFNFTSTFMMPPQCTHFSHKVLVPLCYKPLPLSVLY